jgi:phosphatidylglycerol:prolipoprotein diacylglycerol transferase
MQRTLFYLPHDLWGLPLFGMGWFLIGLAIFFAIWMVTVYRDPRKSVAEELSHSGLMWAIGAAAIIVLLPSIEIRSVSGEPVGVAVRGYGLFLLLGVVSGVALALWRARRAGIAAEEIFSLTLWLFVGGIGGARLFYLIEYRDSFLTGDLWGTLRKMADFTRGGLVVYGSIIGGTIAMLAYTWRSWKQQTQRVKAGTAPVDQGLMTRFLRMGDVVIPCLFLGIFFGRIGCLMNGCCYGGRCEEGPWALHFPAGSPVYNEQVRSGEILGMQLDTPETEPGDDAATSVQGRVVDIAENSPADRRGIREGSWVSQIYQQVPEPNELDATTPEDDSSRLNVVAVVDATPMVWTADELPDRALPVAPAQIISSGSGLVICLVLLALSAAFRLPDGVLMATGFAIYSLARFGEEAVRSDEPGQFGTQLSISQWISLTILPLAVLMIVYIYWRRPTHAGERQISDSGTGAAS